MQKKYKTKGVSFKQEVSIQLNDLKKLLFGTDPSEVWKKGNFGTHGLNILKMLFKTRINFWMLKNVIKAYAQIGFKNVQAMLFQHIRIVDEMTKINARMKKQGWAPPNFEYTSKSPFYAIKEAPEEEGITSYERFNTAINLKEPDRIPITPLMDYYYAANNNMSAKEFVLGPFVKIFNAVKNTYNRFNGVLDMVHLPMGRLYAFYNMLPLAQSGYYGDLVYPDDVPSSLQFIEKGYIDVPDFEKIKKKGLKSIWKPVDLNKINDTQIDLINIGNYINYWENIKKVPIYATSGIVTPLEGLCYLMGINNWSKAIRKNKEEVKEICDLFLRGTMANNLMMYIFTQIKRTYICLERVSSTFISPKNGKYILHIEDSDIFKAKEMLGDRFCLMGNIQTKLLRFGTEQQIIDYTKKLIEICGEGGGYMMAEGCEVAPDTPMKNMKVWIDTTLKNGRY